MLETDFLRVCTADTLQLVGKTQGTRAPVQEAVGLGLPRRRRAAQKPRASDNESGVSRTTGRV